MRRLTILAACFFACVVFLLLRQPTSAQEGSGSSRAAPPRATRPPTPDEFYAAFWKHLNKPESPYAKWEALPGKQDLREGAAPHGEFVRAYANKTAIGDPKTLPYGSILVTKNYDKDKQTLRDITVMYRTKGTDPQHGDWYWLKYLPEQPRSPAHPDKEEERRQLPATGCVMHRIAIPKAGGRDLRFPFQRPRKKADEK